jgi:hypothetical protein
VDAGAKLAQEVGPAAAKKAAELAKVALDHLRKKPEGKMVADNFEEKPAVWQKPLEVELETAVQADPNFKAQLAALLGQYETATVSYQATLTGSGAIAQGPGATALGERAVQVGGNVGGSIVTGDQITTGDISGSGIAIGRGAQASVSGRQPEAEPITFQWTDPVSGQVNEGQVDAVALRRNLVNYFSLDELSTICFDLDVPPDLIPGQGLEAKAREMVIYFTHRERLPELLAVCRRERENVDWLGG